MSAERIISLPLPHERSELRRIRSRAGPEHRDRLRRERTRDERIRSELDQIEQSLRSIRLALGVREEDEEGEKDADQRQSS